jgi:2-dehydro-3-deoxyphosphooctonate aldolase (KDO 8-P synthase)
MMKLILGPCVIESEEHALFMALMIRSICRRLELEFVFKASFDKANRTSVASYRGPGIKEGLRILELVKREAGVQVTTDIHEPWQAEPVAAAVDIIQIPALLARQTDLIQAAARTGRTINLKKGQHMAPEDMAWAAEKAFAAGATDILLTERGTSFGYHDLVVDMRSIAIMRRLGYAVIMDATHAVQRPAAGRGFSLGETQFVETLARAAVAAGADGVFLEVHDQPGKALSDGANSLPLKDLEALLCKLKKIEAAACAR